MQRERVQLRIRSAMVLATLLLSCSLAIPQTAHAAKNQKSFIEQYEPLRDSKAYKQFKTRPVTDLSKLFYLIDRFAGARVEIVYNGHYYKGAFVAQLAKFFLAQNYKKETPKEWIMKWCNVSVPSGNYIWVKFPDDSFKQSREVLMDELAALEKALMQDVAIPPQPETVTVEEAIAVTVPETVPQLVDTTAAVTAPITAADPKKKPEAAVLAS